MAIKWNEIGYVKRVRRKNKIRKDAYRFYSVPPMMERCKIPYPIGDQNNCSAKFVSYVMKRNERGNLLREAKKRGENVLMPVYGTVEHLSIIYMGSKGLNIDPHRKWVRLKPKLKKITFHI